MLDLRYSNGAREEKRTEEVLELFKSLDELSRREVDPPQCPPWEVL